MEEQPKIESLMTSGTWKENNCRSFNSWSPVAKLPHQAEHMVSLNSRNSWQPEVRHWWLPTHSNTRRDQHQAASFRILNSLVVQLVLLEKETLHHNTGCYLQSSSVSRYTNRFVTNFQPHYAFSQPVLTLAWAVQCCHYCQATGSYSNLNTFQMHIVNGLKWSFPHFHWLVRTADVAKQSCPHVSFFLFPVFFLKKKG